jgi:hypothetical protein
MNHTFCAQGHVKRIADVLAEIQRQKASRRDYIYPAAKLTMQDGRLVFGASQSFRVGDRIYTEWADAERAADASGEKLEPLGQTGALPLSRTAQRQLAEKLGIPMRYVDDLRERRHGDLADYNFTALLGRATGRFLVRTLDGSVRAVLSDRYRILDNADVFFASADTLQEAGAVVWNARLWDDGFELFAVSDRLTGEVQRDPGYQRRGHHSHETGGPDVHNVAAKVTNSETGCGGLNVHFGILRRLCNNTAIVGSAISVVHLGRRNEADGLVWSEETQEAESRTIWLKLKDAIRTAFDPQRFQRYIDRLSGLTRQPLANPEKAVANVVREYELSEERKAAILRSLFSAGDLTRYGLVQALTAQVKEADGAGRAEEASDLEAAGGKLIEMADERFAALVAAP